VAENVMLAVTRNFVKEMYELEINNKNEIVAQMNGCSSTDMYLARTIRFKNRPSVLKVDAVKKNPVCS